MWSDKYISIPYKIDGENFDGSDCWGLVKLIYREELGIELEPYKGIHKDESVKTLVDIERFMLKESQKWKKIEVPKEFDLALIKRGGIVCHVGIFISINKILHIIDKTDSTIESISSIRLKNKIEGFFRYERQLAGNS